MRKVALLFVSFVMLCNVSLGQTRAQAIEQMKRNARVNSHIEKQLQGEVTKYLYRGGSQQLYAFVFHSVEDKYYYVKIDNNEGERIVPYLLRNESVQLTVTGDEVLLEKIIYLKEEFSNIQKKLGIELTGMANFKKVVSSAGSYTHDKSISIFRLNGEPEEFQEDVAIVKRRRARGNRFYYALENGDTILVPYAFDKEVKGREKLSYFRSRSVFAKGAFFKSPNTYSYSSQPYMHSLGAYDLSNAFLGKAAVILDKAKMKPTRKLSNSKGLLQGFEVELNGNKESLFFDPKNGEKVMSQVEENDVFNGYYKNIGEDSIVLYVAGDGDDAVFLDNRNEPYLYKGNYIEEEVTLDGKVTYAHFADTKLANYKNAPEPFASTNNIARLKYMIVNDSVIVRVKQIVALNIQDQIKEGMDIRIKGWVRKKVPGEVNLKGYTIMAVNAFTIEGKTFSQKNQNIKSTL